MMLFRQSRVSDLDDIHAMALQSGIGLTTLSTDINIMRTRLVLSEKNQIDHVFVLEDPDLNRVVGTSAIRCNDPRHKTIYEFQKKTHIHPCVSLNREICFDVLMLEKLNEKHCEVCTLYLDPEYRKNGNGNLLSRARFLYMAQYPELFTSTITTEIRGVSDEKGVSPFWDAALEPFFQMSFEEAEYLRSNGNQQFIDDLMPEYPLYVNLMTPEAQAVIGQPHAQSAAAMRILMHEGFQFQNRISIFDAGPRLELARNEIKTVLNSRTVPLKISSEEVEGSRFLVGRTKGEFRAVLCRLGFNARDQALISQETAELLQIKSNETVRVAPYELH